jgi:hypothetical protein
MSCSAHFEPDAPQSVPSESGVGFEQGRVGHSDSLSTLESPQILRTLPANPHLLCILLCQSASQYVTLSSQCKRSTESDQLPTCTYIGTKNVENLKLSRGRRLCDAQLRCAGGSDAGASRSSARPGEPGDHHSHERLKLRDAIGFPFLRTKESLFPRIPLLLLNSNDNLDEHND